MKVSNLENKTVIKWDIPNHPTVKPLNKKKGVYAKSSSIIGGATSLVLLNATGINATDGLFWTMFQEYIYPWFLDLATVFVAIKIAQGFYQENRGGRDSGSGFNAVFTYGKWLLLFHMIPFFVKLMDEIGRTMSNHLG